MSLDFVISMANMIEQTKADIDKVNEKKSAREEVVRIDPLEIDNWEFRDRQDFELGNISELAESIKSNGQAQPIIIVKSSEVFKSKNIKSYVVIAGYRRWLACKSKSMDVDAIIRTMDLEQAIACLVSENEKEKVSDYSKGMFYYNILKKEGIKKRHLYERLSINKGVFDNFISFSEVPDEIWKEVGDLRNVSSRSSATIKLLCQKGDAYKEAILAIAKKISEGIGEKKIVSLVNIELNKKSKEVDFKNSGKIAISDSVFMETKKNQIKLGLKNISDDKLELLKAKICEAVKTVLDMDN